MAIHCLSTPFVKWMSSMLEIHARSAIMIMRQVIGPESELIGSELTMAEAMAMRLPTPSIRTVSHTLAGASKYESPHDRCETPVPMM